jgi:hypothetical protein
MFILAHLDIIAITVLMAFPFYFFNRYLVKKLKPGENIRNTVQYFLIVLITALIYSGAGAFAMSWAGILFR